MVVFLFSFAFVFAKRIVFLVVPPFRLPAFYALSGSPKFAPSVSAGRGFEASLPLA